MTNHSELPWSCKRHSKPWQPGFFVLDAKGKEVATTHDSPLRDEEEENVEFIVKACNSHYAFVSLAKEVAKEYEDAADWKDAIAKLQSMAKDALDDSRQ